MLPKNKLRREYITKVQIYEEAGHDLHKLGLPQFSPCPPLDYNEILQHPEKYPQNYQLIAHNLEDDTKSKSFD